jgi:hypothetical protein
LEGSVLAELGLFLGKAPEVVLVWELIQSVPFVGVIRVFAFKNNKSPM